MAFQVSIKHDNFLKIINIDQYKNNLDFLNHPNDRIVNNVARLVKCIGRPDTMRPSSKYSYNAVVPISLDRTGEKFFEKLFKLPSVETTAFLITHSSEPDLFEPFCILGSGLSRKDSDQINHGLRLDLTEYTGASDLINEQKDLWLNDEYKDLFKKEPNFPLTDPKTVAIYERTEEISKHRKILDFRSRNYPSLSNEYMENFHKAIIYFNENYGAIKGRRTFVRKIGAGQYLIEAYKADPSDLFGNDSFFPDLILSTINLYDWSEKDHINLDNIVKLSLEESNAFAEGHDIDITIYDGALMHSHNYNYYADTLINIGHDIIFRVPLDFDPTVFKGLSGIECIPYPKAHGIYYLKHK